jgi:hypothetical protein
MSRKLTQSNDCVPIRWSVNWVGVSPSGRTEYERNCGDLHLLTRLNRRAASALGPWIDAPEHGLVVERGPDRAEAVGGFLAALGDLVPADDVVRTRIDLRSSCRRLRRSRRNRPRPSWHPRGGGDGYEQEEGQTSAAAHRGNVTQAGGPCYRLSPSSCKPAPRDRGGGLQRATSRINVSSSRPPALSEGTPGRWLEGSCRASTNLVWMRTLRLQASPGPASSSEKGAEPKQAIS